MIDTGTWIEVAAAARDLGRILAAAGAGAETTATETGEDPGLGLVIAGIGAVAAGRAPGIGDKVRVAPCSHSQHHLSAGLPP
jgi:hypothetical protein